jgi:hypothetical protein
MILLVHGFTFAVGLAVLILLIVAVTAIWERLRGEKPELHSAPPAPATIVAVRVGQTAEKIEPPPKKPPHKIKRRRPR